MNTLTDLRKFIKNGDFSKCNKQQLSARNYKLLSIMYSGKMLSNKQNEYSRLLTVIITSIK